MICPKCGYQCDDDAEYCPNCGLVFDDQYIYDYNINDFFDDDEYDVLDLEKDEKKDDSDEKRPSRKPVWFCAIIVFLIAAALIATYIIGSDPEPTEETTQTQKTSEVKGKMIPIKEPETKLESVILQTLSPEERYVATETSESGETDATEDSSVTEQKGGIAALFEPERLYYTQGTTTGECDFLYGPGVQYDSRGIIPAGATVYAINTYGEYTFIEYNGVPGWIKTEYFS